MRTTAKPLSQRGTPLAPPVAPTPVQKHWEEDLMDVLLQSADGPSSEIIPHNIRTQKDVVRRGFNVPPPLFTSVGYEFEFAQLPEGERSTEFAKASHLKLAEGERFPLFPSVPFAVETDMSSVIELAMPPLLAPKDKQWIKTVLLKLESGLKALAKNGTFTIENLLVAVQRFLGLKKTFVVVDKPAIVRLNGRKEPHYGFMQKNSMIKNRFSTAQANVVTTLREAIALANRTGVPEEIEPIYNLFVRKLGGAKDPNDYGKFIAQKISEIPYMFFDQLYAVSLQELGRKRKKPTFDLLSSLAGHPSGKKVGIHPREDDEDPEQHTARKIVSRVKDRGTGWIKSTLGQQMHLFPPKIIRAGFNLCVDIQGVYKMLQGTAAYQALLEYSQIAPSIIGVYNAFVENALEHFKLLFSTVKTTDITEPQIKEQRDHPEWRSQISSARPDTVRAVNTDEDAVLVEIRKATEVLGIGEMERTTNQAKDALTIHAMAMRELSLYADKYWREAYKESNPSVNTDERISREMHIFDLLARQDFAGAFDAVKSLPGVSDPLADVYWKSWFSGVVSVVKRIRQPILKGIKTPSGMKQSPPVRQITTPGLRLGDDTYREDVPSSSVNVLKKRSSSVRKSPEKTSYPTKVKKSVREKVPPPKVEQTLVPRPRLGGDAYRGDVPSSSVNVSKKRSPSVRESPEEAPSPTKVKKSVKEKVPPPKVEQTAAQRRAPSSPGLRKREVPPPRDPDFEKRYRERCLELHKDK